MSLELPLVLLGMMGSGKTSLANALADEYELEAYSLDGAVVELAGKEIRQIFTDEGEEAFRDLESKVLRKALAIATPRVIDCGGGVVDRTENRQLLSRSTSLRYYLDLPLDELISRTGNDATRPMLQGSDYKKQIKQLHARRDSLYREVATHVVTIDPQEKIEDTKAKLMKMLS